MTAYEDLSADPAATTLRVLSHLGLSPLNTLVAPKRRMADATSTEWTARFRAEKGPISTLERV